LLRLDQLASSGSPPRPGKRVGRAPATGDELVARPIAGPYELRLRKPDFVNVRVGSREPVRVDGAVHDPQPLLDEAIAFVCARAEALEPARRLRFVGEGLGCDCAHARHGHRLWLCAWLLRSRLAAADQMPAWSAERREHDDIELLTVLGAR
jgi:hypothetical protein